MPHAGTATAADDEKDWMTAAARAVAPSAHSPMPLSKCSWTEHPTMIANRQPVIQLQQLQAARYPPQTMHRRLHPRRARGMQHTNNLVPPTRHAPTVRRMMNDGTSQLNRAEARALLPVSPSATSSPAVATDRPQDNSTLDQHCLLHRSRLNGKNARPSTAKLPFAVPGASCAAADTSESYRVGTQFQLAARHLLTVEITQRSEAERSVRCDECSRLSSFVMPSHLTSADSFVFSLVGVRYCLAARPKLKQPLVVTHQTAKQRNNTRTSSDIASRTIHIRIMADDLDLPSLDDDIDLGPSTASIVNPPAVSSSSPLPTASVPPSSISRRSSKSSVPNSPHGVVARAMPPSSPSPRASILNARTISSRGGTRPIDQSSRRGSKTLDNRTTPTPTPAKEMDDSAYGDEFELPDEPEDTEDEIEIESDSETSAPSTAVAPPTSSAVDASQSVVVVPSPSVVAVLPSQSRHRIAAPQLYALSTGKKGSSELRGDSAYYNMSRLGGVPLNFPKTAPVGVVLCERAADTQSKRALDQSTRLASLKVQDSVRTAVAADSALRATLHAQALIALEEARTKEREKQAITKAEVRRAGKEFELKATLRKNELLTTQRTEAQQDRDAKAKATAARRTKQQEANDFQTKTRKQHKQTVLLASLVAEQQAKMKNEEESKSADPTKDDTTISDDEETTLDGSSARRRPKRASVLSPFHPPSPLHSSRAVAVVDHSAPLSERLAAAKIDWPPGIVADPALSGVTRPKRDEQAKAERDREYARQIESMKAQAAKQARRTKNMEKEATIRFEQRAKEKKEAAAAAIATGQKTEVKSKATASNKKLLAKPATSFAATKKPAESKLAATKPAATASKPTSTSTVTAASVVKPTLSAPSAASPSSSITVSAGPSTVASSSTPIVPPLAITIATDTSISSLQPPNTNGLDSGKSNTSAYDEDFEE